VRQRARAVAALAAAMTAVGLATAGAAAAQAPSCPWMDTSRTPDQRAQALLAASTLDQKLRWLDEQAANDPTNLNAGGKPLPAQVPCTPFIAYADGPTAVVAGTGVTAFPSQTALAASWDQDLARRKGKAQGYEAFHKRRNVLLAPGLSTARTPLAGRTSEYLGEDPLLSGRMAAAVVKGFGDNPSEPVESVLKHWVANEQETDRQTSSSNLDERTLHELYALPFEIAIKDGQPGGVMCSYNQVNGIYSCNQPILRQILKGDIGFDGWVVTDFGASHSLTATPNSLAAGLDQELNRWRNWTPDALKAALADGRITQAMIDEAAFRVVRAHIRAGLFDTPLPAAPEADVSTPADQAVAREEVEQGSVLLKNTGVLPLGGAGKTIAVIGPTASNTPSNGVSAASVCGPVRPSVPCTPKAPLDAIAARAAQDGGTVAYSDGSDLAQAAQTAAGADVAIVFGYYQEGEFNDRPNLNLDGGGDALVAAVAAANPNTVVVLQTGGPVLMPWLSDVKAVLETWSPGQEMGPATAALLWGDVNPSGRLPLTFPRAAADLPTAGSPAPYPGILSDGGTTRPAGSSEIRQVDYTEGLKVGYRWYDSAGVAPLFPFGFGQSYTSFAVDQLDVPARSAAGAAFTVRFRVTNTGTRGGTDTPQVYLSFPPAAGEPPKRLVGWQRVTLAAGESRTVSVTVDPASSAHPLSIWDPHPPAGAWRTVRGPYTVTVADSAAQPLAGAPLSVTTEATGSVGGTVPATVSLTLGAPASFGAFAPGVDRTYTASTTATVTSTAGDATLSTSDPGHLTNGAFALPEPLQVSLSKSSWTAPVSNDPVAIGFTQHIGAHDGLRTGTYTRTITFTLTTTTP
jgi:beta-glucosidase